MVELQNGIGNGMGIRMGNQPDFFVRNKGRKTAHVSNNHGFFEMISQGCNTALRGITIGLYHAIAGTEIIPYLTIGNEIGFQDDPVTDSKFADQVQIRLLVFIKFTGDQ